MITGKHGMAGFLSENEVSFDKKPEMAENESKQAKIMTEQQPIS